MRWSNHELFVLHLEIRPTYEAIGSAAQRLRREAAVSLGADRLDCFEIAIVESLNNIVEHAYADRPGALIDVVLDSQPDEVRVILRDTGVPADAAVFAKTEAVPGGGDSESIELPESGRGVALIRACTDGLHYRVAPSGNELELIFRR